MTHADVQRWLDRYVEAWKTYDEAADGRCRSFTENYQLER